MLDQMILDELKKTDLNGITILSVVTEPEAIQVVFELPPTKVEFRIDGDCQFQILSVIYNGIVYDDPRYLAQFHNVALDVMIKVKLVETKKRIEYESMQEQNKNLVQGRLEAIALREEKIRIQEQQCDLKEQEIKDREKLLHNRENALALQRQEQELKMKEEAIKNRAQNRERFKESLKDHANDFPQTVKNFSQNLFENSKSLYQKSSQSLQDYFQKLRERE